MVYPDENAIRRSGLTIYDRIPAERPDLYIASKKLEEMLEESLVGISLIGLALRTRSKVVKTEVCKAIGYSVPDLSTAEVGIILCIYSEGIIAQVPQIMVVDEEAG